MACGPVRHMKLKSDKSLVQEIHFRPPTVKIIFLIRTRCRESRGLAQRCGMLGRYRSSSSSSMMKEEDDASFYSVSSDSSAKYQGDPSSSTNTDHEIRDDSSNSEEAGDRTKVLSGQALTKSDVAGADREKEPKLAAKEEGKAGAGVAASKVDKGWMNMGKGVTKHSFAGFVAGIGSFCIGSAAITYQLMQLFEQYARLPPRCPRSSKRMEKRDAKDTMLEIEDNGKMIGSALGFGAGSVALAHGSLTLSKDSSGPDHCPKD
ncbi:hypothetical protein IE53DRAFT_366986 [Violaceomyces palustris]|uniref:Uncharacterized protein n=1 Tax=Violaceomyces palustris TaxID=1673888 RepID=A0ACD0P3U9_9BASI|nr:hypothetical protein IE53DRAFT_366986 [Violaceomyces palustris]